ncbi:MAG: hypothetical protein GX557_09860 [Chloroflexi bacterium]|nr:hypothetical protein [Chloroflexota bacterium]
MLKTRPLILALVVVAAVVCPLCMSPETLVAEEPSPYLSDRQRFGIGVVRTFAGITRFPGRITDYPNVQDLGFGWYSDWWRAKQPTTYDDTVEYVQLLGTCVVPGYANWPPDWSAVAATARACPGSIWIIGNEPEHQWQGGNTPGAYAAIYHEAYHFLTGVDPTAQIAIGGVVQPTPIRLLWLERVLASYETQFGEPMPVDIWNTHIQILCETCGWGCGKPVGLEDEPGRAYEIKDSFSAQIVQELVEDLRAWLVAHGQGDKPLIISEYGVLMPPSYFDPRDCCADCGAYANGTEAVAGFMTRTFHYFMTRRDPVLGYSRDEGRLVQRWLWFSLNHPLLEPGPGSHPNGMGGALHYWDQPSERTLFGDVYRDLTRFYTAEHRVCLPMVRVGLSPASASVDPPQP